MKIIIIEISVLQTRNLKILEDQELFLPDVRMLLLKTLILMELDPVRMEECGTEEVVCGPTLVMILQFKIIFLKMHMALRTLSELILIGDVKELLFNTI